MAKCYDRNGNEDVTRLPCSDDGSPAQCCNDGEFCASNGLCGRIEDTGDMTYWQNTCTEPDWVNGTVESCPTQCAQIRNGGNGVSSCGNELFCCFGFRGCDCNNSTQVFSLEPVRIVTSVTISPSSSDTSTSTSSSSTSTSSDSPTPTPAEPDTSDSPSSSSNSLRIGLGVGLGVGIPLIIAALAALWFLRRRKRRGDGSIPLEGAFAPSMQDKRNLAGGPGGLHEVSNEGQPLELADRPARAPLQELQ